MRGRGVAARLRRPAYPQPGRAFPRRSSAAPAQPRAPAGGGAGPGTKPGSVPPSPLRPAIPRRPGTRPAPPPPGVAASAAAECHRPVAAQSRYRGGRPEPVGRVRAWGGRSPAAAAAFRSARGGCASAAPTPGAPQGRRSGRRERPGTHPSAGGRAARAGPRGRGGRRQGAGRGGGETERAPSPQSRSAGAPARRGGGREAPSARQHRRPVPASPCGGGQGRPVYTAPPAVNKAARAGAGPAAGTVRGATPPARSVSVGAGGLSSPHTSAAAGPSSAASSSPVPRVEALPLATTPGAAASARLQSPSERLRWAPVSDSRRQHPPPALSRRRLSSTVTRRSGSSLPPPPPPHWHAPLHQEPTLTGAGERHSRGTAPPPPPRWLPNGQPARRAPPPQPSDTLTNHKPRGGSRASHWWRPPASFHCNRPRRQPVPRPRQPARGCALRRCFPHPSLPGG